MQLNSNGRSVFKARLRGFRPGAENNTASLSEQVCRCSTVAACAALCGACGAADWEYSEQRIGSSLSCAFEVGTEYMYLHHTPFYTVGVFEPAVTSEPCQPSAYVCVCLCVSHSSSVLEQPCRLASICCCDGPLLDWREAVGTCAVETLPERGACIAERHTVKAACEAQVLDLTEERRGLVFFFLLSYKEHVYIVYVTWLMR